MERSAGTRRNLTARRQALLEYFTARCAIRMNDEMAWKSYSHTAADPHGLRPFHSRLMCSVVGMRLAEHMVMTNKASVVGVVLALAVVAALGSGCSGGGWIPTSQYSGTYISPAHFQFATIVEPNDVAYYGGGWRAVCIRARVSQGVQQGGAQTTTSMATCDLEFGVPIRRKNGSWISKPYAQRQAAAAANKAGRMTVTTSAGITSHTCELIRRRAHTFLRRTIPGATVTRCEGRRGGPVPEVTWP